MLSCRMDFIRLDLWISTPLLVGAFFLYVELLKYSTIRHCCRREFSDLSNPLPLSENARVGVIVQYSTS
jgi:hypothetical protein